MANKHILSRKQTAQHPIAGQNIHQTVSFLKINKEGVGVFKVSCMHTLVVSLLLN